jgi:hypothetical protein
MYMHIDRCREDKKAGAVDDRISRSPGAGMTDYPLSYRDVSNPSTRNGDIFKYKGRAAFHSTHFFPYTHKAIGIGRSFFGLREVLKKKIPSTRYSILIKQYCISIFPAQYTGLYQGKERICVLPGERTLVWIRS